MNFKEITIREYLSIERSTCELEQVQRFMCAVINDAKQGNDEAFQYLLSTKDMRAFIRHTTNRVLSKLNYTVPKRVVVDEVHYTIYSYLNRCYCTHNEPNELQILISSLAKWLPSNISKELFDYNLLSKEELTIPVSKPTCSGMDEVDFTIFLKETLSAEEYTLFKNIYVEGKTNTQIGREMHLAESTIRYRTKQLLSKLKTELTI